MDLSIITLTFTFFTFYLTIFGFLILNYEKYVAKFFTDTFLYGKVRQSSLNSLISVEVPKRWFRHFYVFASVWSSVFFIIVILHYLGVIATIPISLKNVVSFFCGKSLQATVSPTETVVALLLLTIHIFKRFYETHYVCIFSDSKMLFAHYFLGIYHYFCALMVIVKDSPGFSDSDTLNEAVEPNHIKFLILALIFLCATWNQLKTAHIFANLRKNKKGEVVSKNHSIPYGGLFSFVSNPHNFCEIIVYTCLEIILYRSSSFHYIFLWVLSNQIVSGCFSHRWYQKQFKNYPKERKAVIPFVI